MPRAESLFRLPGALIPVSLHMIFRNTLLYFPIQQYPCLFRTITPTALLMYTLPLTADLKSYVLYSQQIPDYGASMVLLAWSHVASVHFCTGSVILCVYRVQKRAPAPLR